MTVPAGLILAAGEGRRLGQPKALVSLNGQLLVDRAVSVAKSAGCDPIVVVLGAAADDVVHKAALDGAIVVVNDGWAEGIGSSLRCGLSALADQHAAAAVVLLVDQPEIGVETVRRVIETWRTRDAVAVVPTYDNQPRNPVLLTSSTWAEVAASARGDTGARAWLREHSSDVTTVACDDLGSDADIDVPADLERYDS